MRTAILIPIRGGSKGIINKAFVDIFGKYLMDYTIEKALMVDNCDVWISSDSEDILSHAYDKGCFILKRPSIYATDTASIDSVIGHFVDSLDYDIIMILQITSPMLRFEDIKNSLDLFVNSPYDSCISVYSMSDNDILFWDILNSKPINYDSLNRGIRQTRKDNYAVETGGLYITRVEQFKKTKCRVGGHIMFYEVPFWTSFEVDTYEDLDFIRKLMRN